ncbi:MAG: hypothetical protein WEA34_03270 [Gemmatimonadota bacterium]
MKRNAPLDWRLLSNSQQEKHNMQTLTLTSGAVLTLAAAVALMPSNANAQDMPDLECTAQVSPAQVEAGTEAVRVTVTFSEDIGDVTGVDQASAHGISIASPMDVPRTEMAVGDETPTPIQMGDDATSWTFWLNTSEAEEGTHSLVFVAGENRCEAELEVVPTG